MSSKRVTVYTEQLHTLITLRKRGALTQEQQASFATSLKDARKGMTEAEEAEIAQVIDALKATEVVASIESSTVSGAT